MVDARVPYGARGYSGPPSGSDDGWSAPTSVRSAAARAAAPPVPPRAPEQRPHAGSRGDGPQHTRRLEMPPPRTADPRSPGLHASAPAQRRGDTARRAVAERAAPIGRGLPGWAGVVVLVVIAGIGGIVDAAAGTQSRGAFNIAIIVASIVAILAVRRSGMFPVVVAPPIVYALASGGMLYVRSNGLHDHKVLFDAAANWLVYGFPAMAAATAAVLIIAGIRMISHR